MIDDQGSPGQAEARYKWGQVLDQLRLQMTKATYDTWLAGSQVVGIEPGVWVVGVRSAYALDWLTGRLGGLVAQTVGRVAGNGVSVRFVVDASPQPAPEMDPGPPEQIIEAVREDRLSVQSSGQVLGATDFYIKLKTAFRYRALARLKGAKLSVFLCLALHVDRDGIAYPGINAIMRETGYSRAPIVAALDELSQLGLITKTRSPQRGADEYQVNGYAWFGQVPAPALLEVKPES